MRKTTIKHHTRRTKTGKRVYVKSHTRTIGKPKKHRRRGTKLLYVGTKEDLTKSWGHLVRKGTHTIRKLPSKSPERRRGKYGLYRKGK